MAKLAPTVLRSQRLALRLSQSALSRQSGVKRPKICIFELGGAALTADEQRRIRRALQQEAERLRAITINFDLEKTAATAEVPAEGGR